MRVLSKKVAVLAAVCILAVLLFAGCDSGIQTSDEKESIEINGWSLSSPEGMGAIRACTAQDVTAEKYVEIEGSVQLVSVSGDANSVLDRVNDLFFGFEKPDFNSPEYIAYMEEMSCRPPEDESLKGTRYVTVSSQSVEGPSRVLTGGPWAFVDTITKHAGESLVYDHGWVWGSVWVDGEVKTSGCVVDCSLIYSSVFTPNSLILSNKKSFPTYRQVLASPPSVGWWNWRVFLLWQKSGQLLFGIHW